MTQTVASQVQEITGSRTVRISILETAVCVRIKFGRVGTSRKVKNKTTVNGEGQEVQTFAVDAEEDLIKVTKKLLDSPQMDAINKFDSGVRKYVKSRGNESGIDDGLYWIGLPVLQEFDAKLKEFSQERELLVDALMAVYETVKENDRQRLRAAFDEEDYPETDKVRQAFKMTRRYVEFVVPRSMQAVSEEIYQQAQNDMNAMLQTAETAVEAALCDEFQRLLDWAIDRLSPGEDGKRKILRTKSKTGEDIGLPKKLHEFFDTFKGRNITSYSDLQNIVDKAEALMTGVDGNSLKQSDTLRESLRQSFTELKAELEPLVADAPIRAIEV